METCSADTAGTANNNVLGQSHGGWRVLRVTVLKSVNISVTFVASVNGSFL